SSTKRTACALKSSSNCRRGRRLLRASVIGRDIVITFRKMSTKPDQAQTVVVPVQSPVDIAGDAGVVAVRVDLAAEDVNEALVAHAGGEARSAPCACATPS